MLWADEQTPLQIDDSVLDTDTKLRLNRLANSESMPNLAIYGPEGTGRHTLARMLIRKQIGAEAFDRSRCYEKEFVVETKPGFESLSGVWVGPERKSVTLSIIQSAGHLEVRPSNAGYYDYLLIKGIMELVESYKTHPVYLLISAADELSDRAKKSLNVQMEKTAGILRFVFVMNNLNRLGEALLSRSTCLRVPAKTPVQVRQVLAETLRARKLPALDKVLLNKLSQMTLRRALLCLQALYKTKKGPKAGTAVPTTSLDLALTKRYQELKACLHADEDEVVEKLDGVVTRFAGMVRSTCPAGYLIKELLSKLLQDNVDRDELCAAAVGTAAYYESRLGMRSGGYHAPVHLSAYIMSLYAILSGRKGRVQPKPKARAGAALAPLPKPTRAGDIVGTSAGARVARPPTRRLLTAPPLNITLPPLNTIYM